MNEMMKIHKRLASVGIVLIAIVMLTAQPAAAQVTADSTTWEGTSFEADEFPLLDNSGQWISDSDQHIATNGTIVDDPDDATNKYINRGPTFIFYTNVRNLDYVASSWTNDGASFEMRGRVNGGSDWDAVIGHIFTTAEAGDTHYYWLTYYIQNGRIVINNSNDFGLGQAQVNLDVTQWRTYRFTMDGTDWNLYIDGDPSPAATLTAVPFSGEGIPFTGYFGWFWGNTANADLDYLRYTDMGALAPIEGVSCGSTGTVYDAADFNLDCYVNLKDYQIFAEQYMSCTDPANAACN